MTDRAEMILNYVIDIKEDVAGMKQHLKTLNGSIKKHDGRIKDNEKKINKFDRKFAYYAGAIAVLLIVAEIGVSYFAFFFNKT